MTITHPQFLSPLHIVLLSLSSRSFSTNPTTTTERGLGCLGSWERIVLAILFIHHCKISTAYLPEGNRSCIFSIPSVPFGCESRRNSKNSCDVYGSSRVVVVSAPGCSRARVSALRLCKPPSQVRKGKDDRRLNEDPYLTSEANYPDDGRETSLRDLDD